MNEPHWLCTPLIKVDVFSCLEILIVSVSVKVLDIYIRKDTVVKKFGRITLYILVVICIRVFNYIHQLHIVSVDRLPWLFYTIALGPQFAFLVSQIQVTKLIS